MTNKDDRSQIHGRDIKQETEKVTRLTPPNAKHELSQGDLLHLLSYLEGELQARDVVIATLKAEKAKQSLYQAKFGRIGLSDPIHALQRDSETNGLNDDFNEQSVGQMYEWQLKQLERLIASQKSAAVRQRTMLNAAERRHAKVVQELELERSRIAADSAQGDNVCMMLEKERERLKQEINSLKEEQKKQEKELKKLQNCMSQERDRHKEVVLYLMGERKGLIAKVHKLSADLQNLEIVKDQRNLIRSELEALKLEHQRVLTENGILKTQIKSQEDDLTSLRKNILSRVKAAQHAPTSSTAASQQDILGSTQQTGDPSRISYAKTHGPHPQSHGRHSALSGRDDKLYSEALSQNKLQHEAIKMNTTTRHLQTHSLRTKEMNASRLPGPGVFNARAVDDGRGLSEQVAAYNEGIARVFCGPENATAADHVILTVPKQSHAGARHSRESSSETLRVQTGLPSKDKGVRKERGRQVIGRRSASSDSTSNRVSGEDLVPAQHIKFPNDIDVNSLPKGKKGRNSFGIAKESFLFMPPYYRFGCIDGPESGESNSLRIRAQIPVYHDPRQNSPNAGFKAKTLSGVQGRSAIYPQHGPVIGQKPSPQTLANCEELAHTSEPGVVKATAV